jgi:hypothetical protein
MFAAVLSALQVAPSNAASFLKSETVALVPDADGRTNNGGSFPTTGFPDGYAPSFSNVSLEDIRDAATNPIGSGFDTVVLNSVCDIGIFLADVQFKSRIESFVSNGGKLIIWDSECGITDYSQFALPFYTNNPGQQGAQGTLTDIEENTLSSANPTSPSYVDVAAVASQTDAVGDANVFTTFDPRWFVDLRAKNVSGVDGPAQAYANLGQGLVIYSGLDKDFLPGTSFDPAATDGTSHLNRIWLLELLQPWNPDNLPHDNPVLGGQNDDDGDGLPDTWESSQGRDLGGGLFDRTLHDAGARPDHKDIFVQIDYEVGASFDKATLKLIQDAFAKAPITNLDHTPGINVHFADGNILSATESDALRKTNGAPDWHKISERYKSDLQYHAYHYVLSTLWDSPDYTGISDDKPGQFIVVDDCGSRIEKAWFGLQQRARKSCGNPSMGHAATLMHELGHNLGLWHGGAPPKTSTDFNAADPYKPNYLSVMNYSFLKGGIPGIGVDYSRWGPDEVNKLDENSLAESDGVFAANPSKPFPANAKTVHYRPGDGGARQVAVGKPVDWNGKNGIEKSRVSGNIDWPNFERTPDSLFPFLSDKILLTSHDDWANLVYNGGVIGQVGKTYIAGPGIAAEMEPTPGLLRKIAAQIEPPSTMPTPVIVARSSESLTIQVRVSPSAEGSLSWAPVLNDGSEGESRVAATVPAGASNVVRFTVPRTSLVDAMGVSVTLETANWKVANAVRTN